MSDRNIFSTEARLVPVAVQIYRHCKKRISSHLDENQFEEAHFYTHAPKIKCSAADFLANKILYNCQTFEFYTS